MNDFIKIKLDKEFYSVINPHTNAGVKIINSIQNEALLMLEKNYSKELIMQTLSLDRRGFNSFIESLHRSNILSNNIKTSNVIQNHEFKIEQIELWIQLTNACNLQCKYCFVRQTKGNNDFNVKNIKSLIKNFELLAKSSGIKQFVIKFSGGEPLLRFGLIKKIVNDISLFGKEYNCNIVFSVFTNLISIDKDILTFIKNHNITINVSLDGIEEYHDINRKTLNNKPTYKIVRNNIESLVQEGIEPNISAVIHDSNIEGLLEFVKFIVKSKFNCRLGIVHGEKLNYENLTKIFLNVFDYLEEEVKLGYEFSTHFQIGELKFRFKSIYNCGAGINSFLIDIDGSIFYCPQQLGVSKPYNNINDLNDVNIFKLDNNFQMIDLPTECLSCKFRHICSGGCPLDRKKYLEYYCEFNKNIIPRILKLQSIEKLYSVVSNIKNKTQKTGSIK